MKASFAFSCLVAGLGWACLGGVNLLQNGDFTVGTQGWKNGTKPSQQVEVVDAGEHGKALKVTVTEPGGRNHGQIVQVRQGVKPNAKYRISAFVEGPKDNAYVQIKLMKGRKEGTRLSTPTNGDGWTKVEKEFDTEADTTGIQVLLRFRMNDGLKDKSLRFAKVALEGVSGGAENDAAPEAIKPPEAKKDVVAAAGSDRYVTPDGAGVRDGTSWENALRGDTKGFAAAVAALGPGSTLHVAGGAYGNVAITVAAGGASAAKPIVIRGEDRGVKGFPKPVFTGNWTRSKPAKGGTFLQLQPGVGYVTVENLDVNNYCGIVTARGPNRGVRIRKISTVNCRDAYWIDGGETPGLPDSGTSDFEMSDVRIVNHTKKGIRTMNGLHHAKFVRIFTDAGGKDFANAEPRDIFSSGIHFLGSYRAGTRAVDHHIEVIDCEANNNYYDPTPKRYWNADGFCAESATADITFIRCKASNNTDGGWDIKTVRPKFIECTGVANKRNFRVWTKKGEVSLFEKCVSKDCWNVGNSGHQCGFWSLGGGEVDYIGCTSTGDDVPFSVEAHAKDGEVVETVMKIRETKVTPKGDRIFGRMDGKVTIDTDGSVAKPE